MHQYVANRNVFGDCLKLFPPIIGFRKLSGMGIPDRRTSHTESPSAIGAELVTRYDQYDQLLRKLLRRRIARNSYAINQMVPFPMTSLKQELSYRKQIARQLRTQNVEGTYNPVTLKSLLKGHSRSLETEPLDRSYTTYYWSGYLTLNIIATMKCRLEVTQGH